MWEGVWHGGSRFPPPSPYLFCPSPIHPLPRPPSPTVEKHHIGAQVAKVKVSKKQLNSNLRRAHMTSEKEQQEAIEHIDEVQNETDLMNKPVRRF